MLINFFNNIFSKSDRNLFNLWYFIGQKGFKTFYLWVFLVFDVIYEIGTIIVREIWEILTIYWILQFVPKKSRVCYKPFLDIFLLKMGLFLNYILMHMFYWKNYELSS